MPTILTSSPKGGVGKSTVCLMLATEIAANKGTVALIDADPQGTNRKWAEAGLSQYSSIVHSPRSSEDLTDLIDELASQVSFVIVDVQGTANRETSAAMSRADLVLIPSQPKAADAEEAALAFQLVRSQEKMFRREIPHRLLFTRANPMMLTREERSIIDNMAAHDVPRLDTRVVERAAFSAMYAFKLALDELDPNLVSGIQTARRNVVELVRECVEILRSRNSARMQVA